MIGKLKNWPDFFHYCSFSVRQLIFWFSFCLCLARLVLLLWPFYWSWWWCWCALVMILKKTSEWLRTNKSTNSFLPAQMVFATTIFVPGTVAQLEKHCLVPSALWSHKISKADLTSK
jgi:hypothetical protein